MELHDELFTGFRIVLAAIAVFIVVYPSIVFITNVHLVTLVYALIPSIAIAVILGGGLVQYEVDVFNIWLFSLVFAGITVLLSIVYRHLLEPVLFDKVFEIHFVLNRFSIPVRIVIVTVVIAVSYFLFIMFRKRIISV